LRVFRVCPARHADSAFSGEGAKTYGGRWNPPGTRAVYCAENRSLAALEILVHLRGVDVLPDLAIFEVQIPASVAVFSPRNVPAGWDVEPVSRASQDVGAAWIKAGRSAVLRVPSAVVPAERNFVLNPDHPDFAKLSISKPARFVLDARLLKR
jgi:RES domain-containing protein